MTNNPVIRDNFILFRRAAYCFVMLKVWGKYIIHSDLDDMFNETGDIFIENT